MEYCTRCHCELTPGSMVQLTFEGGMWCAECVSTYIAAVEKLAKRPEARDDGR